MELRQLHNFLTVVDQRSVSRAASLLHLAQPALSRQIRALEEELGADLLVRHGWGVTPTPEGEILATHARGLLRDAQAAREAVSAFSGVPSGKLTVGVPSSMAAVLLPGLALAASAALPGVELRLVEGYSATLHQRTLAGQLDLAVLYSEPHLPAITRWPLLTEPLVAIGQSGVLDSKTQLSIGQLIEYPLLLPAASNRLRILFEEAAARAGAHHQLRMEVDSVPALLELVRAGLGVSILPFSSVKAGVTQGHLSMAFIGPRPLTRSLILARPRDRAETPAWTAVAGLLLGLLRDREEEYGWKLTLPDDALGEGSD